MGTAESENQAKRASQAVASLWRYYDEHAMQARQHETLRATVTSILSGIAAAVASLAGLGGLTLSDIFAGLIVIAIGVLGGVLSIKHYERNRLHTQVLRAVREEITTVERDSPELYRSTQEIRRDAERRHEAEFSIRKRKGERGARNVDRTLDKTKASRPSLWINVSLFQLWIGLNVIITIIGILIVIFSVVGISA